MTDPKGAKLAEADKAKLRAAAEKATPGPWHDCDDEDIATVAPGADCSSAESFIAVQFDNRDDARYIAAVNPAVILALLDELAALQAAATAPPGMSYVAHVVGCARELVAGMPYTMGDPGAGQHNRLREAVSELDAWQKAEATQRGATDG